MDRSHQVSNSFQRIGAKSNAQVGRDFENVALQFFKSQDLILKKNIKIEVDIEEIPKKFHAFDLGCKEQKNNC